MISLVFLIIFISLLVSVVINSYIISKEMRQIEAFEAYDKVVIVTLILHFLN